MSKSFIIFISIVFAMISQHTYGQTDTLNTRINWLTIEEAEKLASENPRKIFVDIYTDWCGWCKRMDANTFSHPDIVTYINENYYAVKLNAEQTDPITFRGTEYINENPTGRRSSHNFARAVLQGRMSYPSVAFFDEELNLITAIPGYREPAQFEPILVFFKDDHYVTQPNLDVFIREYMEKAK
jgi:thioredoxin-related protein